MAGSPHWSGGDIQFKLVYGRGQCAESSYLKDENVVFINRNEKLSKEVEELTDENRKLNQDNIYLQDRNTVLEHVFS